MKYEIETSSRFKHSFKRLLKKYRNLDKDFENLLNELHSNPNIGVDLGGGVRKVRMAISDKVKGKSHGARIITYTTIITINEGLITLLAIYDKADKDSISAKEISLLLKELE